MKLSRTHLTGNQRFFRPALATTGAVLTALFFFWLRMQIVADNIYPVDRAILLALRKSAELETLVGPKWFLEVMIAFTKLGGATALTLIMATFAVFVYRKGAHRLALIIVGAVISGRIVVALLKEFFQRPRPDIVEHLVTVHSASFPSGHSASSAIAFFTIAFVFIRFKSSIKSRTLVFMAAILLTFAVGISRIALGVHWPSDVLAGWVFGVCWACLWALPMERAKSKVGIVSR